MKRGLDWGCFLVGIYRQLSIEKIKQNMKLNYWQDGGRGKGGKSSKIKVGDCRFEQPPHTTLNGTVPF